jgi:hypothetical protein
MADVEEKTTKKILQTVKGKNKRTSYILIALSLGIMAALSAMFAKFYFSFIDIDEQLYADSFYGWRVFKGDKIMYESIYKFIKGNTFDEKSWDGKYSKYVEMAQGRDSLMLLDGHPEHFPRGYKYYFTHSFQANDEEFLKFRKAMVDFSGEKVSDDVLDGTKEHPKRKMFLWETDVRSNDEVIRRSEFEVLREFMKSFAAILVKLKDGTYKEGIGKEVPGEISADIKNLCKIAGHVVDDKQIHNFFVRMGKVTATPIESFIYSRGFYLIYLNTLDCKMNFTEKDKKDKKKRIDVVADCYAQLFSRFFEYKLGSAKDASSNGFTKFLRYAFGLSTVEPEKRDNDIDVLVQHLTNKFR